MTFPNDENGDVLRRMARHGDDLSKPREIEFAHVFADRTEAGHFCEAAARLGYKTEIYDRESEASCDAICSKLMLPTHADITETEARLAKLAREMGGHEDGWGCFQVDGKPQ